jgi:hypothetical protein
MRVRTILMVSVLAIFAASACGKRHKTAFTPGPPPAYPGSYAQSCRNITTLPGGYISAECADSNGRFDLSYIQASICQGDIGNKDGLLVCNGAIATINPPPPPASDAPASDAPASDSASSQAADLKR